MVGCWLNVAPDFQGQKPDVSNFEASHTQPAPPRLFITCKQAHVGQEPEAYHSRQCLFVTFPPPHVGSTVPLPICHFTDYKFITVPHKSQYYRQQNLHGKL